MSVKKYRDMVRDTCVYIYIYFFNFLFKNGFLHL